MSESPHCPKCNVPLPADAPAGLCPKCLVLAAFESHSASPSGVAPTRSSPASAKFEPPAPGELADKFPQLEILELLGKGGMGAVYKARQRGLDRLVAVKILPPEVGRDAAFAERFAREARALARLSHSNIVSVYDFGRTDDVRRGAPPPPHPATAGLMPSQGTPETFGQESDSVGDRPQQLNPQQSEEPLYYIVMEYVDGLNLRQTIQSGGLAPADAVAIVPQICEALQFAHDEGIVHRDIKPENILIDRRGRVKIADFGLAKLLTADAGDHSLTATHQVMGTLRYMAPEQLKGSCDVDHRADIYSLGVVFYELLTGELPMGKFAPPSKRVQVDVRLDEVVLRALEQQPDLRYQHASEVKTDLEHIARLKTSAAEAVEHQPGRLAASADVSEIQSLLLAPANMIMTTGILALVSVPLVAGFCLWALESRVWVAGSRSFWRWGDEEFWYCLLYFQVLVVPAAVFTILAAQRMRRCELRGMALSGASLALIPWSPAWLVGLPAGVWGLMVLGDRDVKAAFQVQSRSARAKPTALTDISNAALPSTIVIAGFVTLLSSILTVLLLSGAIVDRYSFDALFRKDGVQILLFSMQAMAIPAGIFMMMCGLTLKSGNWGLVRLGAILSLVPLTPSWLLTMPLGLYVLIEMARTPAGEASATRKEKAAPPSILQASAVFPVRRPRLVPVLATLNLVGATLLMLICAMDDSASLAQPVPRLWQVWDLIDKVLGFAMAAGMYAASIGLFLWKPWGRKVTLGVCVFGLASFVFDAPYMARFVLPDLHAEIQRTVAAEGFEPDAQEAVTLLTFVFVIGGIMVPGLPYLVGQLVYFNRPRVVAAFASPNETQGNFLDGMFTFAGAILGVLSVFGPLALLLALTALFNLPDEQQAVDAATGSSAQRADADAEKGEPPLQPAVQPAPN